MSTAAAAASSPLDFTLHYGQSLAWQARETHRIISVFAGTGGGKTWMGPRWWYPIVRENLDATYIFLEPTFRMIKRVMFPAVLEYYDALGLGEMHLDDMEYRFHKRYGKGKILFASVDNPQSIQGIHVDGGIWCDEIGLYSEEAWDVVLQRTALHKAKILNTSTPYTLPWVERRLAKPSRNKRTMDQYFLCQFASWMNPGYPIEQFWELKRQWPADKFKRLMLGLFVAISGLMFEEFQEDRNLAWIEPLDGMRIKVKTAKEGTRIVELVRTWLSQDWGWTDPAVQYLFGQDALGRIYMFEEDYESHIPVDRGDDNWIKRALDRQQRWYIDAIYCDPSMPAYIDGMCSAGLPAIAANNKIDYGTDEVNQAFLSMGDGSAGLYVAMNACPEFVRTVGSYVRQRATNGEGYLPKPAPYQDDHCEDACRYGIVGNREPTESTGAGATFDLLSAKRRGT